MAFFPCISRSGDKDDFGTFLGQFIRRLREILIVAGQKSDASEIHIKHGMLSAGSHTHFKFGHRQMRLEIPPDNLPLPINQKGGIINFAFKFFVEIAYIGGDSMFYKSIERRKAFVSAMNAYGLPIREELISTFGWSELEASRMAEIILMKHPEVTAICAANDKMADAVIRTLRAKGTRIPEDISVTGFGCADSSALLPVPLTTVKIDYTHFARELLHALMLEMENPWQNPSTIFVETELTVRSSTGMVSLHAPR